jgi:7-cyano-7-deazaguanine synthase
VTYVPARNLILLALALSYAEARQAERVYFGANSLDYSGYPDCRPDFLRAFSKAAELGTKAGAEGKPIEILAPLQNLAKAEILQRGLALGVDYSLTWSCYQGEKEACGKCDSCRIRLAAFAALGLQDPIHYSAE